MEQNLFNYNDEDIDSVVNYSHKLLNRKFAEVMEEYNRSLYKTYEDYQNQEAKEYEKKEIKPSSKGQYGNYIERYYYGTREYIFICICPHLRVYQLVHFRFFQELWQYFLSFRPLNVVSRVGLNDSSFQCVAIIGT